VQFIIDHATVTEKTICFDDLKQESKIIT
jgi:hypothetical protein